MRLFSSRDWSDVRIGLGDRFGSPRSYSRRAKALSPQNTRRSSASQQLVRPVDRRAQRLLSRVGVAPALQEVETPDRAAPRSCSGEKTTARAAANSSASGRLSSRAHSSRTAGDGVHSGAQGACAFARKSSTPSRSSSGGNAPHLLARQLQALRATSRATVAAGRRSHGAAATVTARCGQQMLRVVQRRAAPLTGQAPAEHVRRRRGRPAPRHVRASARPMAALLRDRAAGASGHPPDAVREGVRRLGGRLQSQARLSRAARDPSGVTSRTPSRREQRDDLGRALSWRPRKADRRHRQVRPVEAAYRTGTPRPRAGTRARPRRGP